MIRNHAHYLGALVGLVAAASLHIAPLVAQNTPTVPPSSPPAEQGILVEHCMVRYINKTKVPAETQGKLTELKVEEGMFVRKGDVIAIVDNKQSELALKARQAEELEAKLNAQNTVNKRDAVNSERIAAVEFQTYQELHEKGAAPYLEMKKKGLEAERARLRIELADLNEDTALAVYLAKQAGTELAKLDIEMRLIRAEFDAFVENRLAQYGEWVQPGSPIVELVQMDRLRVEGFIDALSYAGQVRKGAPVEVEITVGRLSSDSNTKKFAGQIEYVSTELDLNKRHRIWVSIPNERVGDDWLIKPGMSATMRILPEGGNPARDVF